MAMPKVLCCGCCTRIVNLDTAKLILEKIEIGRQALEILPIIRDQQYSNRIIVSYKEDIRCNICESMEHPSITL